MNREQIRRPVTAIQPDVIRRQAFPSGANRAHQVAWVLNELGTCGKDR